MTLQPRAVLVHRLTGYDEIVARHGTPQNAAFYLECRGRSLQELAGRRDLQTEAMGRVGASIPVWWRRATIERTDLARFAFAPDDVVVVVGQDGLVANVAKYLDGQPVVGINPDPERNPGVLVKHSPARAGELLAAALEGRFGHGSSVGAGAPTEDRTMVEAETDDGEILRALNEVYIGHRSHQSSRYRIEAGEGAKGGEGSEHQSSSGVLVGTGTGSTGWLRSAWQERRSPLALPAPTDDRLAWFVREAWPSPVTGTSLTEGLVPADDALVITAESDELVCFGDGIETDALVLRWGQRITVRPSARRLRLVL